GAREPRRTPSLPSAEVYGGGAVGEVAPSLFQRLRDVAERDRSGQHEPVLLAAHGCRIDCRIHCHIHFFSAGAGGFASTLFFACTFLIRPSMLELRTTAANSVR